MESKTILNWKFAKALAFTLEEVVIKLLLTLALIELY